MKPILFVICNLFLIPQGFGQVNWVPTGAKWHYEFGSFLGGGLTTLEVVNEDTLIGNHVWKKLLSTTITSPSPGIDTFLELFYVFEENQVVYGYDPLVGGSILYDFNATVGDTLEMYFGGGSPSFFIVDSIGTIEFNCHSLTFQDIRYPSFSDSTVFYEMRVIEGMGSIRSHFFHTRNLILPTDAPTYHLRCYEDENIGLVNLSYNQVDCDYIEGVTSITEATKAKFSVFPNPSNDDIQIDLGNKIFDKIELFDFKGIKIKSNQTSLINISDLDNGIYFIRVIDSNKESYITKVLKTGS